MSVQAAINEALLGRCRELAVSSPALRLVEAEERYQPVVGQPYLVAQILVGDTATLSVGRGRRQYVGILQITVVHDRHHGIEAAVKIADAIVDHFKKGTIVDGDGVRVKINRHPSQASPAGDGAWLRVPVSIPYHCMA